MFDCFTKKIKFSKVRISVFVAVAFFLLLSLVWQNSLDLSLRLRQSKSKFAKMYSGNGVAVNIVDVGQGNATILQMPDGKTILIDAGSQTSVDALLDFIQNNIATDGSFECFDAIVVTSANQNSVGGLPQIIKKYANREHTTIFRPNTMSIDSTNPLYKDAGFDYLVQDSFNTHDSAVYRRATSAIHQSGCNVQVNQKTEYTITSDSTDKDKQYYFSILPFADMELLRQDFSVNNASPIMILEYGNFRAIFSGTAQSEVEKLFVQKYSNIFGYKLPVDAILLGGNGGKNSTSQSYLDFLLQPDTVEKTKIFISASTQNSNTTPDRTVLDRLYSNGISKDNIFNTAKFSHIQLKLGLFGEPIESKVQIAQQYLGNSRPYLFWWRELVFVYIVGFFVVCFWF